MSRISFDAEVLDELAGRLLDRGLASIRQLAAPTAVTGGAIAITYTTDDPGYTPDGTLTIADGTSITILDNYSGFEECIAQIALLVADTAAIRTALATAIADGATNSTAPVAMTARAATLAFTYTANDPSITVNQAVTIADGDTVDDEEYHEFIVEAAAELDLVFADLSRMHAAVSTLINAGLFEAPVVVARTSRNGGVAITYTTDDPSYTPDGSVTVADGDLMTSVNGTSIMEEINNDCDFLGDDFVAMKVAYDLYLDAAGKATS